MRKLLTAVALVTALAVAFVLGSSVKIDAATAWQNIRGLRVDIQATGPALVLSQNGTRTPVPYIRLLVRGTSAGGWESDGEIVVPFGKGIITTTPTNTPTPTSTRTPTKTATPTNTWTPSPTPTDTPSPTPT